MTELSKEQRPLDVEMHEPLTEKEIAEAVRIIRKTEKGNLPRDLFNAIAEKTTTPIVELVPVRRNRQGEIEILLTRRPPDDPYWPNMLHTPGNIVRAKDTDPHDGDAMARIRSGELEGLDMGTPIKVYELSHNSERGRERSDIYCVEVYGEPTVGEFYPANALPADLVPSQLDFIPTAVHNYESRQQK